MAPIEKYSFRSKEIKVCFDPPVTPLPHDSGASFSYKDFLQTVSAWASAELKKAGLTLSGWQPCIANDTESIHIRVHPKFTGWAQRPGLPSRGVRFAVNIGYLAKPNLKSTFRWRPRHTLLHELLHAIGFLHEQDRTDSKCAFDTAGNHLAKSSLNLGDYDPDSIMNYCRKGTGDRVSSFAQLMELDIRDATLTKRDIQSIRAYLFEPIAEFKNHLPRHNGLSQATFHLKGSGVSKYRYVFGLANSIDCNQEDQYGSYVTIQKPLNLAIPQGHGLYKLCVLGANDKQGQSVRAYSSTVWQKTPASLTLDIPSDIYDVRAKIPFKFMGENFHAFFAKMQWFDDEDTRGDFCRSKLGYQRIESPKFELRQLLQWPSNRGPSGVFRFCAAISLQDAEQGRAFSQLLSIKRESSLANASYGGVPSKLTTGQLLEISVRSNFGYYQGYRFQLVGNSRDCAKDSYSQSRPTDLPISFKYQPGVTDFICIRVTNQNGFTATADEATIIDLREEAAAH